MSAAPELPTSDSAETEAFEPRTVSSDLINSEVARRRTFGIISHPDAGKTTLTEKLLLFSGAIQLAGTVKGRKSGRHATSDWMDIEKPVSYTHLTLPTKA
mgnify:CR=1 FL=1